MHTKKSTQNLSMTILIWFVLLQTLQPFIHGHLDLNHPMSLANSHAVDEHTEFMHLIDAPAAETFSDDHVLHTVAVASGIKSDTQVILFTDFNPFVLLCLCFTLILLSVPRYFPQQDSLPHKSLKRRLPAPRAPPLA